ncbi:ABC transporter permease [Plantibacter sp. ME-Dv--P-122b]|uniref:ABC transporter permease n=1 Tax=Plantibacter sp. ME-Dv--P-122b TaxID=3040300 RepID=UPI00254CCF68|nr:ABC transporter permease [Plantibacter sp. ME-Dv--P-122b]
MTAQDIRPRATRASSARSRASASGGSAGNRRTVVVGGVSVAVVILLCWQFLPGLTGTPGYVVPALSDVLQALVDPAALPRYVSNAGTTLGEVLAGLAIGVVIGLVGAILLAQFPTAYAIAFPYIVAIESIPKVAIAPLFVIWFGFGMPSKIVVVVLLAFFPVLVNTIHGIRGVDRDQVELFEANGASAGQIRRKLLIPAALPSIFSGLELAVANAMIGAIVAEFVGAQHGLGVLILQAQGAMQTAAVFALLIILSALGITLNALVRLARRKVIFWQQDAPR